MSEVLSPTILNKTLTNANTEYTLAIPGGTKHFSLQCRTAFDVKLGFITGMTDFVTVKSGGAYTSPEKLNCSAFTLYLKSAEAGVVVEVVCWS